MSCLTCVICLLWRYLVSFSLSWYVFESSCFAHLLALGLNTLTSKNSIWPACQNSRAHTSYLTSFPMAADGAKDSSVKGCKCGSFRTSLHTSLSSDDAMYITKFYGNHMKSSFLQGKACQRSNFSLHSQHAGSLVSAHL